MWVWVSVLGVYKMLLIGCMRLSSAAPHMIDQLQARLHHCHTRQCQSHVILVFDTKSKDLPSIKKAMAAYPAAELWQVASK